MSRFYFSLLFLLVVVPALGQFSIQGIVQDSARVPLPGVNVVVKGTNNGTVANTDGAYKIGNLPSGDLVLVFSFIGYASNEVAVHVPHESSIDVILLPDNKQLDEVEILSLLATRGSKQTATTYTNLDGKKLNEQNFGQDMPFLLNWTPSVVTTSDAGTGIGYTGIRVRGSDATRVNVTINGIPYNDSESQTTFWVDIPDIASSTRSVQIQRGVGTSTNGPGAFGASVNVETNDNGYHNHRFKHIDAVIGAGSFGTQRYTLRAGTGYMGNFYLEARGSKIMSDGYVDRATADLTSYYAELGFDNGGALVQLIAFGGKEKTYQAWYGVDSATLATNRTMNYAGAIYDASGNVSGYYPNQVDDYKQDHLQLHVRVPVADNWEAKLALHSTWGHGYYEEYHQDRAFASVGLPDAGSADMVLRKWLDNRFYGLTYSVAQTGKKSALLFGGALSHYSPAKHYGEIVSTSVPSSVTPGYRYYDGNSEKGDGNVYAKWTYKLTERLSSFVDLQYRGVFYQTEGTRDDQTSYQVDDRFHFFNPKGGFSYDLEKESVLTSSSLYLSYAVANREPNRSDYLDGTSKPRSERLHNLELGWRKTTKAYALELNGFHMYYIDQLVQTGALDGAGYPIRANVGNSFRTGLEVAAQLLFLKNMEWSVNTTWSINQNKNYVVTAGTQPVTRDTRIILSPDFIVGSQVAWKIKGFEFMWLSKLVGSQYLDNTESASAKLDSYGTNDLRVSYGFAPKGFKAITWSFLLNNVFNAVYSSNGASYDGVPYYFPQAGRNFMAMMTVKL